MGIQLHNITFVKKLVSLKLQINSIEIKFYQKVSIIEFRGGLIMNLKSKFIYHQINL